jgi:hypothetical protein
MPDEVEARTFDGSDIRVNAASVKNAQVFRRFFIGFVVFGAEFFRGYSALPSA